jgi:hypothetical protein
MKKALFVFLAVALSALASAQVVNLSGSWTLDAAKSSLNEQFSLAPKTCKIIQTDNGLTIEKKLEVMGEQSTITEKFNLDGSETTNPGIMQSVKKSKVALSADKKSIKITSKTTAENMDEISVTEIYSIENDKLIYQTTSSSSSFGDMSETARYNKS